VEQINGEWQSSIEDSWFTAKPVEAPPISTKNLSKSEISDTCSVYIQFLTKISQEISQYSLQKGDSDFLLKSLETLNEECEKDLKNNDNYLKVKETFEKLKLLLPNLKKTNISREVSMQRAYEFTIDISKEDNNKTSDQTLLEISVEKNNLIQQFLRCLKETAIDCQANLSDNLKGDASLRDEQFRCLNTNQITSSQPKHSPRQFITIPGQEFTLIKKTSMNKLVILSLPQIENASGAYNISALFNPVSGLLYDLYIYYSLDPTIEPINWSRPLKPIGKVYITNQIGKEQEYSLDNQFISNENKQQLQKYDTIERVRKSLEESNPNYKGIPSDSHLLKWIAECRNAKQLIKFLPPKDSNITIGDWKELAQSSDETIEMKEKPSPFEILGLNPSITSKEFKKWLNEKQKSDPSFKETNRSVLGEILKRFRKSRSKT
jgi:hypothetical protein